MKVIDCRKIKILQAFSKVKNLAENGNISEAQNEMFKIMDFLEQEERNALMNTFVDSIMKYNESIKWNDICHS